MSAENGLVKHVVAHSVLPVSVDVVAVSDVVALNEGQDDLPLPSPDDRVVKVLHTDFGDVIIEYMHDGRRLVNGGDVESSEATKAAYSKLIVEENKDAT
jgi:hypothetical protein